MFFFASVALINPSMHHNDNGTMQKCFFRFEEYQPV